MVFDKKNFNEIFEAMRERTSPTLTDFQTGSVVRTLYESFAYEIAVLYEEMQQVYLSAYVDTAEGIDLDKVVAILGIKRGEPDYATGIVTFERDLGIDENIIIPLGTLVTTEDTEESPKKSYRTIEPQILYYTENFVDVRVQAIQAGETEVTPAQTITIMPLPIPGVKAVNNLEAIVFTGKLRETDEQLRERAKKALIAASNANTTSIESALLSLPGVREVKVRENFYYAQGKVTLSINEPVSEIKISKGTQLTINIQNTTKKFATTETTTFSGNRVELKVQALIGGKAGELNQNYTTQWQPLRINDLSFNVSNLEPIELRDFGMIEVFVDGIDFTDTNKVTLIKQEIERVRAAGIYAILKPATPIQVDGIFYIELDESLHLSPVERYQIEQQVTQAINAFLKTQQMGKPLLISQLTRKILDTPNVNDLLNFTITTTQQTSNQPDITHYDSSIRRLEADILEKFVAHSIFVASEIKPLIVDVEVKVQNLNEAIYQSFLQALQSYFQILQVGENLTLSGIKAQLYNRDVEVEVQISPYFWHPSIKFDGETVPVSFVEKAQLGKTFIYSRFLTITGAVKLTLPITITRQDKDKVITRVRQTFKDYLEQLKPEENIKIEKFVEQARKVLSVLDVDWKLADFQILDIENARDRIDIDKEEIRVEPFEKPQLADDFAIDSDINPVPVAITKLHLRLNSTGLPPENINIEELKTAMTEALRSLFTPAFTQQLPTLDVGVNLDYNQLRIHLLSLIRARANNIPLATLQTLIPAGENSARLIDFTRIFLRGADYILDTLELTARETIFTQDIPIRIVERAQLQSLNLSGDNLQILVEITGG